MANFTGTAGSDVFYGGPEADIAAGLGGDDYLLSGAGDDVLDGGDGTDLLVGGYGADTLDGGAGDDRINGGRDQIDFDYDRAVDILRGGAGADLFQFEFAYEGRPGNLDSIDRVLDFSPSEGDQVQLASYVNRPLAWGGAIATPGFSLTIGQSFGRAFGASHQGVFTWTNGSTTYLIVDTDGGDALHAGDFVVAFEGAPVLGPSALFPLGDLQHLGGPGDDVWSGEAGDDIYFGRDGDDRASGLGGDDLLDGEGGDDVLNGGDGQDILAGGAGDDELDGGAGDDVLVAGGRFNGVFDTIDNRNVVRGGAGDDRLIASDGVDLLDGGEGNDYIEGGRSMEPLGEPDQLFGGAGDDEIDSTRAALIDGGAGDDLFNLQGRAHTVRGGDGADTFAAQAGLNDGWEITGYATVLDFNAAQGDRVAIYKPSVGAPMVFSGTVDAGFALANGQTFSANDLGPGFTQVWTWASAEGTHLIIDVDRNSKLSVNDYVLKLVDVTSFDAQDFTPGTFDGPMSGTSGPDVFQGGPAIDTYYGLGGDDIIRGGGGQDTLYGNEGDDGLWGEGDEDWLYGGRGDDEIHGGDGFDVIRGGAGDDVLYGEAGNDNIQASGNDEGDIDDETSVNRLYGGDGDDSLSGGNSTFDQLFGGAGDDSIAGNGTLYGEAGNDSLLGGAGATLHGGEGDDFLRADWNAVMHGGTGRDSFSGGSGADTIHLDLADQVASGGGGDDLIVISDTPAGQIASLTHLWGGSGRDTFRLSSTLSAPLEINGEQGVDVLDLRSAQGPISIDLTQTAVQETGVGRLALVSVDDILVGEFGGVLTGDEAANGFAGGAAADTLRGGGGGDVLRGGGGDDILDGGAGADVAAYSGPAASFGWAWVGETWVVRDLRTGAAEGVDTLSGVETLRFTDKTIALLPTSMETALSAILRWSPTQMFEHPSAAIIANLIGQGQSSETVLDLTLRIADSTTTVATLSYQFFTDRIPLEAGLDYLVAVDGPNPNNLNSPYYQSFNLENRYINFAVNLGVIGEGRPAFEAEYGNLSLFEATRAAYAEIFGKAPSDAKVHLLIDTRVDYFATYGGDGPEGLGTKAAMVGWLLAEAAKSDLGVMSRTSNAWLKDLADGDAPFEINVLDPGAGYWKAEFIHDGG